MDLEGAFRDSYMQGAEIAYMPIPCKNIELFLKAAEEPAE